MRIDLESVMSRLAIACLALAVFSSCAPARSIADDHADHGHAEGGEHGGHGIGHDEHDGASHADDEHSADHSEEAGHGAAGGHGDKDYNKPPLDFEPALFIWSLVVFGLFLLVGRKLAWGPLIAGLSAREARVSRALADAEAARIEAERLIALHDARINEVTEEVKGIVAQARQEAEQEKVRILAEAEAETNAMRDKALAEIESGRRQALDELETRIDSQVQAATDHLLSPAAS